MTRSSDRSKALQINPPHPEILTSSSGAARSSIAGYNDARNRGHVAADGIEFGQSYANVIRMLRPILIVERHREVADALEQVIASADHAAIVRANIDGLDEMNPPPAAIVLRIAFESGCEPTHAGVARLPPDRPPIVAIVRADAEADEAERLKCDVVLRAPQDLGKLRDVLAHVARART